MASASSISQWGGSSSQTEVRIVLLGDTTVNKSEVAKSILGFKNLIGETIGQCTLYRGEDAGRNISVLETPGWNRSSIQQTLENVKTEIIRSVSLFPPGPPDALLLVLPVKDLFEEPSADEITETEKHMELLSERVWKHTIVVFYCDEGVKESTINEHIHNAEKILKKCSGRFLVVHRSAGHMKPLFNKIECLVKENHGDFFMPQIYYERFQSKSQVSSESEIRRRRGSFEMNPPDLGKDKGDSDEKKETLETVKHTLLEDIPAAMYRSLKPIAVILMGIIGALIGSVAGAEHGVLGACTGLVSGIIVGVVLAILTIYICTYIYSYSYPK